MTIENQHGDGITSDNNVIEKGIDIRDAGSGSANPNEKKNNRTKNSKKEKSQNKMPKQNHPGKGNKPKGKVVKNVPHKDQYQRISFLYQAANAMAFDPATEALGRMYTRAMKDTAKKSVLRLYVYPYTALPKLKYTEILTMFLLDPLLLNDLFAKNVTEF